MEGSTHDLILRYYPGICPEGLKKPTKTTSGWLVSRPRLKLKNANNHNIMNL
jgi:hypothetical protein